MLSLSRLSLQVRAVPRLAPTTSCLTFSLPTSACLSPSLPTSTLSTSLPSCILSPLLLPTSSLHTSASLERARQSTRIKKRKVYETNKKKKEARLKRNPPPIPKKVQLMLQHHGLGKEPRPWRTRDAKPFPTDDVWSSKWHSWPRFPVTEALSMLREHYHPTMLNRPDSLVWAKLEFNMQASKKEKYIDGHTAMVPIYHTFERGVAEKHVMVFAKDAEAARAAEAAGAAKAGGLELVEDVARGRVDVSDIDFFLAHDDIEKELKPLLGILREKMPRKQAGTVGSDMAMMVKTFGHGMEVTVAKPKRTLGYIEDPAYAACDITVGRLNMADGDISANLSQALDTLRERAPKRKDGGWITRCRLYCGGPSNIKLDICHDLVDDERYKKHLKEKLAETEAEN